MICINFTVHLSKVSLSWAGLVGTRLCSRWQTYTRGEVPCGNHTVRELSHIIVVVYVRHHLYLRCISPQAPVNVTT